MKNVLAAACLAATAGLATAQLTTINGSGTVNGNGNTGFGGVIGPGTLDIETLSDGTVNMTVTRGAEFFNQMVIYIDTGLGGFNTTANLNDTGDGGRIIASGANGGGQSVINFASGFNASHAVSFESGFIGVFELVENGAHNFAATANGSGFASSDPTITISFNLAEIGLAAGDSFDIVANYFNAFDGGGPFRSDEWFGANIAGGNTGQATVDLDADSFIRVNSIPTPGGAALLAMGGLVVSRRRR